MRVSRQAPGTIRDSTNSPASLSSSMMFKLAFSLNALAVKRKFLSVHRRLQRQFANVRSRDERFLSGARQDQHTYALVIARIEQRMMQFLNRLPVQRVQHLRPVEGNVCDAVFLFKHNIGVSHKQNFLPHNRQCNAI